MFYLYTPMRYSTLNCSEAKQQRSLTVFTANIHRSFVILSVKDLPAFCSASKQFKLHCCHTLSNTSGCRNSGDFILGLLTGNAALFAGGLTELLIEQENFGPFVFAHF